MPTIWISYKQPRSSVHLIDSISFTSNATTATIVNEIRKFFCISKDKLIRLRKQNGALVVIDKHIQENPKKQPLILESIQVCKHDNCIHKKSAIEVRCRDLPKIFFGKSYFLPSYRKKGRTRSAIESLADLFNYRLNKVESNVCDYENRLVNQLNAVSERTNLVCNDISKVVETVNQKH
jgi:hypothetical protein